MTKTFISFHHENDQEYKERLLAINQVNGIFEDYSVDTGDIGDDLDDQTIRTRIRDEYLRESSVTLLLVGRETKKRKHIDWEIYSSMIDGTRNTRSGIVVVNLPSTGCQYVTAAYPNEKEIISPNSSWTTLSDRTEYERRYPFVPKRIIDQLLKAQSGISVVDWNLAEMNPLGLKVLIENADRNRTEIEYDLSRPMRRTNS